MGMNSKVSMSFSKSKFGKNPIFGQDKLDLDIGTNSKTKSTLSVSTA